MTAAAGLGGARRRRPLSADAREGKNRRRREVRLHRKGEREEEQLGNTRQQGEKATAAAASDNSSKRPSPSPTTLLPLLSSAAASSHRFLADHDLLLRPSQILSLESALSRLHSLLLRPPFPLPPPSGGAHGCNDVKTYWFHRFLASTASDGSDPRWVEAFRMSRPSFYLLLQTLAPSLSHPSSSLPPDHKLGAALFRLAHAAPFRAVARRFGMEGGSATACRAFYEVCRSVIDQLGHLFELTSDIKRVVQGFRWVASLPNCCGVIGFARFATGGSADGVVALVVVDSEGRFLDVSAGWPGSMPPSQILPRTKLFSAQGKVLPGNADECEDKRVSAGLSPPRYFLGGSCCPLLPWLLTPFPESDIVEGHPSWRVFNEVHAHGMKLAAKMVEAVRLRWRLLLAGWSGEYAEALPFVVVVCCLLHNFLFKCSEIMPGEEILKPVREERFSEFEGKGDDLGEKAREELAAHLYSVSKRG